MWEYNHGYSNELYHWGTKGMKWGYTDGHSNGKRTASREDTLNSKYRYYQGKTLQSSLNKFAGESNKSFDQYYTSEKNVEKYSKLANKYGNMASTASGLDYKLGYSVGKLIKDSEHTINKGKKLVSGMLSKLSKTLPSIKISKKTGDRSYTSIWFNPRSGKRKDITIK